MYFSEPKVDYCTYVDPSHFLSMVDRGANYSRERKQKGWDIMWTYLSLVKLVINRCRVVV
jgi:hypothetical protein